MRILDLFCGAGGAAMGLHQAFPDAEIVGVDINPQPRYPFTFVQMDWKEFLKSCTLFDLLWASPMCQHYSWAARRWHKEWPNQVPEVRKWLVETTQPYVIENVVGAPLINPTRLCGMMFNIKVIRHRLFESSFVITTPYHPRCGGKIASGEAYTVAGHGAESKSYKYQDWADAMGIQWMTKTELTQSIPPAYSHYIGEQFKISLERAA